MIREAVLLGAVALASCDPERVTEVPPPAVARCTVDTTRPIVEHEDAWDETMR